MLIRNKRCLVYNCKVFLNYFSVVIKDTESNKIQTYEVGFNKNDLPKICKLFIKKNIYFCTYNATHYNVPIINFLLMNYTSLIKCPIWEINNRIKSISDTIINSQTSEPWRQYKYANLFYSLDLMTMLFSKKHRTGLKPVQITMDYSNVEDYSINFNNLIEEDNVDIINNVNLNDVLSIEYLMNKVKDKIDFRINIYETMGINVINSDDVNLGVDIVKINYLRDTKKKWDDIKNLKTYCDRVKLNEILLDSIYFKTPELQALHKELLNTTIDIKEEESKSQKNRWKKVFYFGDIELIFSCGGLHSNDKPMIYQSSKDKIIVLSDCESMYPNALINNNWYPSHLGQEFLHTYNEIKEARLKAKHSGNKFLDAVCKKAITGISGMLQSEYSWCYDPKTAYKLRLNCQLMMLMLIERLYLCGCEIKSVNTDGVMYMTNKDNLINVKKECKEWQDETKFVLSHDFFESVYRYDINNYIGVKEGYKDCGDQDMIKAVGLFSDEILLGKGMFPRIIPECLVEYFVNNIPVEDTLYNCKDIHKFLTYEKIGRENFVEYGNNIISRVNRYYMSASGYTLNKCKLDINGKPINKESLCQDFGVIILNKIDDNFDISKAKINYSWYRNEIYKIIYTIEDSLNPKLF